MQIFTHDIDLRRVAELEARAFGPQLSLDVPYLKELAAHGVIFGETIDDILVSEAQLELAAIGSANERLLRDLPVNAAYLEGFAVDPLHRGKGYGTALLREAKRLAKIAGKEYIVATARLENVNSLAVLTRQGYYGEEFDSSYYGRGVDNGARVILRQSVTAMQRHSVEQSIAVHSSDLPDKKAEVALQDAFAQGLALVSVSTSSVPGQFLVGLARI